LATLADEFDQLAESLEHLRFAQLADQPTSPTQYLALALSLRTAR
jgi:hypothetical protein